MQTAIVPFILKHCVYSEDAGSLLDLTVFSHYALTLTHISGFSASLYETLSNSFRILVSFYSCFIQTEAGILILNNINFTICCFLTLGSVS